MDIYGIGCKPIYPVLSSSYLSCNICACVWVRVCACVWGQTWLREEDTWCDRLGTESGRKAEENVFPQRDCVQKPENCNLRYEYITQLLVIGRVNVMQQRLLAPRSLADCDWGGASFSADTKKKKKTLTFGVTMRVSRLGFALTGALRLLLRSPCCWLLLPLGEGPRGRPLGLVLFLAFWLLLKASVRPEEKCSNLIWKHKHRKCCALWLFSWSLMRKVRVWWTSLHSPWLISSLALRISSNTGSLQVMFVRGGACAPVECVFCVFDRRACVRLSWRGHWMGSLRDEGAR